MRWIDKGREPAALAKWKRENPEERYRALPTDVKAVVREALLAAQGFICAYTMRRIGVESCHYKAARKPLTFSHGEESRSARKRGIFLLTQACRKRASPICDSEKGVKRAEAQAHGRYQDAVSLLCRADEVHSLCGIAPLISDETESVAIRRLFVRKDEIRWSQKL